MKIQIVLIFAISLLSQNAFANFDLPAECKFNQTIGDCRIYNLWSKPVTCDLKINGKVKNGSWFRGHESKTIQPGGFVYIEVHADKSIDNSFVSISGSADCHF